MDEVPTWVTVPETKPATWVNLLSDAISIAVNQRLRCLFKGRFLHEIYTLLATHLCKPFDYSIS